MVRLVALGGALVSGYPIEPSKFGVSDNKR